MANYKGSNSINRPGGIELGLSVHAEGVKYPDLAGYVLPDTFPPYGKGSRVMFTAFPRYGGYAFSHWILDKVRQENTDNTITVTMDKLSVLEAHFDATKALHKVTAKVSVPDRATLNMSLLSNNTTYKSGDLIQAGENLQYTFAWTAQNDYEFVGWEINGVVPDLNSDFWYQPYHCLEVSRDDHIVALIDKATLPITLSANAEGGWVHLEAIKKGIYISSLNSSNAQAAKNQIVKLSAFPNNGYKLSHWLINDNLISFARSEPCIRITKKTSINAVFIPKQ